MADVNEQTSNRMNETLARGTPVEPNRQNPSARGGSRRPDASLFIVVQRACQGCQVIPTISAQTDMGKSLAMTRWLRQLLLVLLSLTLPVYGWAAAAIASPCPMQTDHSAMKADTCCQDTDHADAGNPCKAGQECQTGALYQAMTAGLVPVVPQSTQVISPAETQLIAAALTAVWRPPLSL